MKLRRPDLTTVTVDGATLTLNAEGKAEGVSVEYVLANGGMDVLARADKPLRYVRARWNFTEEEKRAESVKVLGDAWERAYGELGWDLETAEFPKEFCDKVGGLAPVSGFRKTSL